MKQAFAIRSVVFLLVVGFIAAAAVIFGRFKPITPPLPPTPPPSKAVRIVSLSPAIAVMLRNLGLQNLIVGRDGFDLVLPKDIPVCGDWQGTDYERLLSVHPTHILMQRGAKPIPDRLRELAATENWTVTDYPLLTLDDIETATRGIGSAFGAPSEALINEMHRAWSKRGEGFAGAGRVLLLAAIDPPSALGPGSFHHQILERIGGLHAVTSGAQYITMDAEDVLRLKPDAIILILPRESGPPRAAATPDQVRAALGRLATLDIPAMKTGRLALIDDPLAHTPSPAMIQLADEMARILTGWNVPH